MQLVDLAREALAVLLGGAVCGDRLGLRHPRGGVADRLTLEALADVPQLSLEGDDLGLPGLDLTLGALEIAPQAGELRR